jgi:hypothetical protein
MKIGCIKPGATMCKPVFDVLLLPEEWRVLKTLHLLERSTSTRVVKEAITDSRISWLRTHQILGRLSVSVCPLVTRDTIFVDGPFGPERQVLWRLSTEGKKLFA